MHFVIGTLIVLAVVFVICKLVIRKETPAELLTTVETDVKSDATAAETEVKKVV